LLPLVGKGEKDNLTFMQEPEEEQQHRKLEED
jgi:hypothetical protein